jgi:hypothetical protein
VKRALFLVFVVALAVRLTAAAKVAILDRDGVQYLAAAESFERGDVTAGLEHHYPPLYPVLVAATERLGVEPEPAGMLVSCVTGALAAVLGAALAGSAGTRSALVAGLVLALHPACVELSVAVLADGVFVTLLLAALLAAKGARWPLAGGLTGLAYLARPEGIVVTLLLAARARKKAPFVLAAALAVVLPYMAAIKKDAGLNGGEAGVWKLTKKRELFLEAGGERVLPRGPSGGRSLSLSGVAAVAEESAARLAVLLYHAGHALKELGAVLLAVSVIALAIFFVRGRQGLLVLGSPRGVPDLDASLALLLVYSLIRSDERYGEIAAALLLPWLGAWLGALVRPRWLLALALLAPLLPATRARHVAKACWRDAGLACRGLSLLASSDPRVAFYAGARNLDLHALTVEEARREGAQAIVVRDDAFPEPAPRSIAGRAAPVGSATPIRLERGPESEAVLIVPVR